MAAWRTLSVYICYVLCCEFYIICLSVLLVLLFLPHESLVFIWFSLSICIWGYIAISVVIAKVLWPLLNAHYI